MKILDEIVQLLQSPSWFLLGKAEFDELRGLVSDFPSLSISDVTKMIENKVELPKLSCGATARQNIVTFLKNLLLLEALLLQWNMELHKEWSVVYPVVKTEPVLRHAENTSSSKALNNNSPDGPALVDLMVMLLPTDKNILKKMAAAIDVASYFTGIGQLGYLVTNFFIAISFCSTASNKTETIIPDSAAYPVKQHIEKNEIKNELKISLHAYLAFHFNHIVDCLKLVYKKAPAFYFEISSSRIASDEIANIKQAFQNETSPYYGDTLLMFHLNKYVIIQDILQLLSHPATKSDDFFSECLDMLFYYRGHLSKVPPVDTAWYSFFSGTPAVQVDDKKLFGQIYSLTDKLNAYVEPKKIKETVNSIT